MAKNNKKKIIAPIASIATSAVVATTAGLVAVNKDEITKSSLDVNVSTNPLGDANEYGVNKQRQEVTVDGIVFKVPFNHEILNGYAHVATVGGDRNANIQTLNEQNKKDAIIQAIKHTFNKETYGDRYNEQTGEVTFGTQNIANNLSAVSVTAFSNDSANNTDTYTVSIAGKEFQFTVPSFEIKTVDATTTPNGNQYSEQYKAVLSSYISGLNPEISVSKPRTDAQRWVFNDFEYKTRIQNKFSHGRIFYQNTLKTTVDSSLSNGWTINSNAAFDKRNLKFWYSMRENTMFVYNNEQKRAYAFKNWGAYINLNELLTVEDIFLNLKVDDESLPPNQRQNVFINPAERDLKIKQALENKFVTNKTNVRKIGKEEIPTLVSIGEKTKLTGSVNGTDYYRYFYRTYSGGGRDKSVNPENPNLSYDTWTFTTQGFEGSGNLEIKVVETVPFVHTTIGYDSYVQSTHNLSSNYIKGLLEIYKVFNGRKKITLKELNDINPNNYLIKKFFRDGDSINKGSELSNNAQNDLRSTNMLFVIDNNDEARAGNIDLDSITIEIITIGDRSAFLIENAISLNTLVPSRGNNWERTAGRPIKYLIDDLPILLDDSKYRSLTEEDYLRWGNAPSRVVKNGSTYWNSLANNDRIRNQLGSNNSSTFNALRETFARNQVGWTIFQMLTSEFGDESTQKFDLNGKKIDFNRLIPFVITDNENFNESLVSSYAITEYGSQFGVARPGETNYTYKVHAIVKNRQGVVSPYFKPQGVTNPGNGDNKNIASAQTWNWNQPGHIGTDGLLTTRNFISLLNKAPVIKYDNPYEGLNNPIFQPPTTASGQNEWEFKISKKEGAPEKKVLYDPNQNIDLRDGYYNVFWSDDIRNWRRDKKEIQAGIGSYFTKYMFKNHGHADNNSVNINATDGGNRYATAGVNSTVENYETGILTGLETIQYYPEYSAALVSDNGYYRDWDSNLNKYVTKRRMANGAIVPAIKILYNIPASELSSSVYDIFDLAQNNWNKKEAIRFAIDNKKVNAYGEKILSENFSVINPRLSDRRYKNQTSGSDDTGSINENVENELTGNTKFNDSTPNRLQIDFEDKFGKINNIYLYDLNIINPNKGDGEQVFTTNVPEFNDFFKGVLLNEKELYDLPQSGSNYTDITNYLSTVKASISDLNVSTVNFTDIKVGKVGERLVIKAKTGRKAPARVPDNNYDGLNPIDQEFWTVIENLPLYYRDIDVHVDTPNVKQLIDSKLTFEEFVLKELNTKHRNSSNNNKITFGPATNPDMDAENISDLSITIDYESQTFTITNITNSKSVKVKATLNKIPQVKYINATALLTQDRDYVNGLKFINEDLYSKIIKLDATNPTLGDALNPSKGNPNGYIDVPTNGDQNINIARDLYHFFEEIKNQFPSNMRKDLDLANAQVRFDANNKRLILVDNGDQTASAVAKPAALVIDLVPNTLWSADLVDPNNTNNISHEDGKNKFVNKVLENNGDVLKTINSLIGAFADNNGKKYIGGYALTNPTAVNNKQNLLIEIRTDDPLNPSTPDDGKKFSVGLYDEYSYFLNSVDGAELFSDYTKLAETINAAKYNDQANDAKNIMTDFAVDLNQNAELVEINTTNNANNNVRDFSGAVSLSEHANGKVKVKYVVVTNDDGTKFGRFIVKGWIEEGNNNNKPALYNIDNIPNVVSSNQLPSLDEIITSEGDEYKAIIEKWKTITDKNASPNLYFENSKMHIGLAEFNLDDVDLNVDTTRKYLSVRNKADKKLLAVVILSEQLKRVIKKNSLYTWEDVVDNQMDLATTIANKVAINSGLPFDQDYYLDGYALTTDTSKVHDKGYYLVNGSEEIFVIDDHKYDVRETKTELPEIGNQFDGHKVFTNQNKFVALYRTLTDATQAISSLDEGNVKLLKDWLTTNDEVDNAFKSATENATVRKYKDTIVVFSNPTDGIDHVLAITNLPGTILDSDINLEIPTIDELIAVNKSLKDELIDRLLKLNSNHASEFKILNNTYDKNQAQFEFDYANNRITITQGDEKADIIQSSRNFPNVKVVEANETKPAGSPATSIDFDNLTNAYHLNNLYKEIARLPDYSSQDEGAKLLSALRANVIETDSFNLKLQFDDLTKDLVNGTNKLFDKDASNMTIEYDTANDRLIIKDNDNTPTALVIKSLKRYTDLSSITFTSNIATNSVNNLEVKTAVDNILNGLEGNPNKDNAKSIGSYEVYDPEFMYATDGDLYAKIAYKGTHDASDKDKTIYIINNNKYADKVEYNNDPQLDPVKFLNIRKNGSQAFTEIESYSNSEEKQVLQELFAKASGANYRDFNDVKYKFIVRNRQHDEIMFSATKTDDSNFPTTRNYFFKLTNLINVVDDSSRNLKTPNVADIIAAGFDYTEAFKNKWTRNSSDQYNIGTAAVLANAIKVDLDNSRKFVTVKNGEQVVGYVIFKNPIESVNELDYKDVPADQLRTILKLARNFINQVDLENSRTQLKSLQFQLQEKLANFDDATISIEIRPDGSLLIFDQKQESPNYLLLKNVPTLIESNSFYSLRDVILRANDKFDPKPIITEKWSTNKQIGGKVVVNPVENTDSNKRFDNFFSYKENDDQNKFIYVYDSINYIENVVSAKTGITNTDAYKASVLKARINEVTIEAFDNNEINTIITNAGWGLSGMKVRVYGDKLLVTGQKDGKTYRALIKELPKILDASGLDFPTEEDIIYDHFGNVSAALKAVINDTNKTPRDGEQKIAIYNAKYDPANVVLEFLNSSGAIKFTYNGTPQNQISPSIPFGSYTVVDADGSSRTKMSAPHALEILNAIKNSELNESNQAPLGNIANNEYIASQLPTDLDKTNATIEYVLEKNMIIIRGSNPNGNRLIITNVPRIVDPYTTGLYTIEDVAMKSQDAHATLNEKYTALAESNNTKTIGEYVINSPSTLADKDARNVGVYTINSTADENENNKFTRRPIIVYDAIEYATKIDSINRNTFNTKNDLKLILDNVESTFKLISAENKLLNASIQTVLETNGIRVETAEMKSITIPNGGLSLLIKGLTDTNKTKVVLISNLPKIIPTKFDDVVNVLPVINANDLLNAEGNTLKARMESGYAKVIKKLAEANQNNFEVDGNSIEIGEITIRANDVNNPVEFEVTNTKDSVSTIIGTIILPNEQLPKFNFVTQPSAWINTPQLASTFYDKIKEVTENNFTNLIADENFSAILPNDFDKAQPNLAIVYEPNDKGLYVLTDKHLVIVNNPVFAVDHKSIYTVDEVIQNSNDVNGLLDKKIKLIANLEEANRKVGDYKVPEDIQVDRKDKGFNTLAPRTTVMRRIYVIDEHTYKRPVSAENVFRNNVALKALLDQFAASPNQYITLQTLNSQELNTYINSQNAHTTNAVAKLVTKEDGSKVIVLETDTTKQSTVFAIDRLPTIYHESEINVTFPTKEDLIAANGDVNKAIIDKFTNKANNKIVIKDVEHIPSTVKSKINSDGSITLTLANNEKVIVTSANPLPTVYSENASANDYAKIYEATKLIVGTQKDQTTTNTNFETIKDVEYIQNLIAKAFGSNAPANLNTANVKYKKDTQQLVIDITATNDNFGFLVILNKVPQVIEAREVYSVYEAIKHIDNLPEFIKTKLIEKAAANSNKINEFALNADIEVAKQNATNFYVSSTESAANKINNIYIVDQYQFVTTKIDASKVFKHITTFFELSKVVKNSSAGFNENTPLSGGALKSALNNENFNTFSNSNTLFNADPKLIELGANANEWVINQGNAVAVFNNLPQVSDETTAFGDKHLPTPQEVIESNGNYIDAVRKALANDSGKIIVNGKEFDATNATISVGEDNTISFTNPDTNETVTVVVSTKIPKYLAYNAKTHTAFKKLKEVHSLRQLLNKKTADAAANQFLALSLLEEAAQTPNNPLNNVDIYPEAFKENGQFQFDKVNNRLVLFNNSVENPRYIVVNNYHQTIIATDIYSNEDVVNKNMQVIELLKEKYATVTSIGDYNNIEQPLVITKQGNDYVITGNQQKQVYVIDGKIYDTQPIDGSIVFDSLKTLYRFEKALGKDKNNVKTLGSLADIDGLIKTKLLEDTIADVKNLDYNSTKIQYLAEGLFVLEGYDRVAKTNKVIAIRGIPKVVKYNDASLPGITEPTADEVTAANGSVAQAIKKKLEAAAVGDDAQKTVTINGQTYPLSDVDVRELEDGTVQIFQVAKPGQKEVPLVSIVQDNDNNSYAVQDASEDQFFAKSNDSKTNSNNLISSISDVPAKDPSKPEEKSLAAVIAQYNELKKQSIDADNVNNDENSIEKLLERSGFDVAANPEATIKYDPVSNQFVVSDNKDPANIVIINGVAKSINSDEIYTPQDVLLNNIDVVKTIRAKLNEKAKDQTSVKIGKYDTKPEFTLSKNRAQENVITDSTEPSYNEITVIAQDKFAQDIIDGSKIFTEIKPFKKLSDLLKAEKTIALNDARINNNQELVNELTKLNIPRENGELVYINDFLWMVKLPRNQLSAEPNIYGIALIPFVVDQDQADFKFPSIEEVIATNGNIEEAFKQKIAALKPDKNGNVIINGQSINPNYTQVEVDPDGSVKIYTYNPIKPNERKLVVGINQENDNFKTPVYLQRDGSELDYLATKALYDKFAEKPLTSTKETEIKTKLINILENNTFLIDQLREDPTNKTSNQIDINIAAAIVTYDSTLGNISIESTKNGDDTKVVVVIKNMKNVIRANELYDIGKVKENNPVDIILKALEDPKNQSTTNKKGVLVGNLRYEVISPFVEELEVTHDNDRMIVDSNNKVIYIIDNSEYLIFTPQQAQEAFANKDQTNDLVAKLNKNSGEFTPANELNDPQINALLKQQGLDPNTTSVAYIDGNIQLKTVNPDGSIKVASLPGLDNAVSSDYVKIPSDAIIIADNANKINAIKKALENPEINPQNEEGKIRLGSTLIDPTQLLININPDNTISLLRQNPANVSEKILVATWLPNQEDKKVIQTNYKGYNSKDLENDSINKLLVDLTEKLKDGIESQPLSSFLNNNIIKTVTKEDFNLANATIAFNNEEKTKIVIRNNDLNNPKVIVIYNLPELSEAQNSQVDEKVAVRDEDKVRIWAPIVAAVAALFALITGLSIGIKKAKAKRRGK